jgi:hypothetical protein
MKKSVIKYIAVIAICVAGFSAQAQNRLKMELGYNVSSPLGSFKNDFISNSSFRGGTGEISYAITPKFSLGLNAGFQSYYEKFDRQLYKLEGNQVVSAVVTNTLDVTPLILRGTYFPLAESQTAKIQPYVSAGAGVNLVSYGQYLGEFGGNEASVPLAAQAGAGIQIPFGRRINQTGFKIGATYNYVNYNKNNLSGLSNLGVNAGVVFALK